MLSFSSLQPRRTARLLLSLAAALLAVAPIAPAGAAATHQTGTEAGPPSYLLPAKPSVLLRAPMATWRPVLAQAGAVLGEHVTAAKPLAKSAQIELQVQRTILAQTQQAWPTVLDAVKKTRQLQDGESGRQTAGLLNELLARQALNGGDAAWLQRQLRDQVLAMPWADVEATILTLRQQLAIMKGEAIETFVANRLDISAAYTENHASLGFVAQLLAMRFQLLEVLPRRDALVAGLDEAIAQRLPAAASAASK